MSADWIAHFWAKVDKSGDCWLWTGSRNGGGYGKLNRRGKTIYAHRYSFEARGVTIPEGMLVDHACRNRACVRPEHLRIVTQKQNMENLGRGRSGSRSGVRGVSWNNRARRWQVTVGHAGTVYSLGYFADLADAESAAVAKRNELFTHNDADRTGRAA